MKAGIILNCLFVFFSISFAHAQVGFDSEGPSSCGSSAAMQQFLDKNPYYKTLDRQIEQQLLQYKRSGQRPASTQSVVNLPVVVHIIHNNGPENISNARVLAGIQHLNEAFANIGYYNPADGVNTNIQFCLAQRDPNGNLTNGITRDVSPYTNMGGLYYYSDDLNVKDINRWNPSCYINIWLVNDIPGSVAGYAYLPSAAGSNVDGIIEEASYFGSSNANDIVVIHEMGHYLGLYHTFEEGCNNTDCLTDGDKVCDTPPDNSTSYTSCSVHVNSCSTDILSGFTTDQNDLTEDYMDYGNWDCMSVFTQGQADRMNWFITNVRSSLLLCLSCQTPCLSPVTAAFTSSALNAPAGTVINFTNTSVNGSTYAWYVNGTLVSAAFNYSQQFTQQGIYIVRLLVTSATPAQCRSDERSDTIRISCPVVAAMTPGYNGVTQVGQSVSFINNSINATSYEWYYDNALVTNTTNYSASFNTLGTHYIKLKAIAQFCSDSFQVYYVVNPDVLSVANASFQKHFETNTNSTAELFDYGGLITATEDIIVVGAYNSSKNLVTKFTNLGTVIWSKRYDDNNALSRLMAAINTSDGNYLFAGDRWIDDITLIKVDVNGNIIWTVNPYYDNSNYYQHQFNDVIELADGSFILLTTLRVSSSLSKIFLYKISSAGAIQWTKTFEIQGNNTEGAKLYQLGNGVYVTGSIAAPVSIPAQPGWDGLLFKIDPATGSLLFAKRYDAAGTANRFLNIVSVGNKLLLNGYIVDPVTAQPSNTKTLDFIDLNGNVLLSKELKSENSAGSGLGLCVNSDNKFFVATNDRSSGQVYLNKFDSSLQFVAGRKYMQNTAIVNVTNIYQLTGGNMILTGNRGEQHTVMIRTLPDLTTPGCNDSIFVPIVQASGFTATDITNSSSLAVAPSNFYVAPFVAQALPTITHTVCNYIPVAATCDSALVQNYYTLPNAGISGVSTRGLCVTQKADQHFLVATLGGFTDAILVETDKNGTRLSSKIYPGLEKIADVKATSDGGYIVLGTKQFGPEFYLLKYNAANTLQWSKQYDIDGYSDATGTHIYQLSDNGYFITARFYLVRVDASGNFMFAKRYTNFGNGPILSLIEDGPNILFCMDNSPTIIKMDKVTGNLVWEKQWVASNIIQSGINYITSYIDTDSSGYVVKFDPAGNVITTKKIHVPGSAFLDHKLISAGSNGSFVLLCNKKNYSEFFNNRIYVTAFDSSFNVISSGMSAIDSSQNGRDILIDADGRLITVGDAKDQFQTLVNQSMLLFKTKITDIGNNCVFVPNTPVVSPGPAVNPGTDNYNGLDVTVTVGNISLTDSLFSVFTNRLCVSENCNTNLTCDTANCNIYSLSGIHKICHLTDTVRIHLSKGNGCALHPAWAISGTATYQSISQNDSVLTLLFTAAGNIKIRAKTISSCKIFEDSLSIDVYNSPSSLTLGPDIQLCNNSVAVLHAGAGFQSYQWQDHSTDSTFTAYLPGSYYVSATDFCGNIYRDTVNIIQTPSPAFSLGPDTTRCDNDTLSLTAPPGFSNYTWGPNYNINSTTGPGIRVWPAVDTIYTVTAVLNNSCTVIDSIRISVKQSVPIHLGNDTSFCQGGSVHLDAGPGFTNYLWSTAAVSSAITVSAIGSYSVAATDLNGCISKDTIRIINVFANPVINLGNDTSLCQDKSISLSPGNGFTQYLWQDGSTNATLVATNTGLYWVQVKNNNNCVGRDSLNIISIFPNPVINIGNDTSFCNGQSINLSPGTGFAGYTWQDNSTGQNFIASAQGLYWVEVKDINNCKGRDSLKIISLFPKPLIDLGRDTSLCKGQAITLDAGNGFSSYTWQDNSHNHLFVAAGTGIYWVQVTNSNGCMNVDSVAIINMIDTPHNFILPSAGICTNEKNYIKAGSVFSSYLWSTGSTLDSVLIMQPGNYWLQVTNSAGCKGTEDFVLFDKECVKAVYFPNAFTPNNDNLNETFRPKVYGELDYYHLEVFNRYGQKLFESNDWQKGWDGSFKGKMQGIGAYIWSCSYKLKGLLLGTIEKGTVLLLR